MGLIHNTSGRRIFLSRVNFLCWLLFWLYLWSFATMPNTVTKSEWFRRHCPGKIKTGGHNGWDDIQNQELSLVLMRLCVGEMTSKSKNCLTSLEGTVCGWYDGKIQELSLPLSCPDATMCGWDDIKIQELTLSLILRRPCAVETTVKSKNSLPLVLMCLYAAEMTV